MTELATNVLFKDESGNPTDAQLLAFEDTWHRGPSAEATYRYLDLDQPDSCTWLRDRLAARLHRLEVQTDRFANQALDVTPGPAGRDTAG